MKINVELEVNNTNIVEGGKAYSMYAVNYYKSNCYENDKNYNEMFLKSQERYANELLKARGFIFLNEIYNMLGCPVTKAGQVVGWMLNSDIGDGYIKFEIDGDIIDFNVDGMILDKIEEA
ncbi:MAG: DUF6353 family protein [Lachnospira sp.]|nr:DUF6353 family protein [Lachnospira sp.]